MKPILSSICAEQNLSGIARSDSLDHLKDAMKTGVTISSSGTTGIPKTIFRTPENLKACNEVALAAQEINSKSSIYTVTRLSHAGGLLAQSLPALTINANVEFDTFNPYSFFRKFSNHTHTFLPPEMMESLSKTKSFQEANFDGRWILTGSSPVNLETIKKFVARNAVVQPNWGMSEIGPIVINSVFRTLNDVEIAQSKCPRALSYLGDTYYCEIKIVDGQLHVRSPMCIHDDWFPTGDLVVKLDECLFYDRRIEKH